MPASVFQAGKSVPLHSKFFLPVRMGMHGHLNGGILFTVHTQKHKIKSAYCMYTSSGIPLFRIPLGRLKVPYLKEVPSFQR